MEIVKMALDDIIPAEYNPRKTLTAEDEQYNALVNSVSRFGLVEPLIVNGRNNVLVGGHQRLNVLKSLGETEAEVVLVDLDDEQEKTLNVALNKIEGDWDYQRLEKMIKDMAPEDVPYTGFSAEEIESIIGVGDYTEIEEPVKEHLEDDTPEPERGFEIYISFRTKEEADEWLHQKGFEEEFGDDRALIINMEDWYAEGN